LMNDLLSLETKNNVAKVFYKLLIERKNVPMQEAEAEVEVEVVPPQRPIVDNKVLRRRSVGAPTRASRVSTAVEPPKAGAEVKRRSEKRASQRAPDVRRSERPITRFNKQDSISRERSATVGSSAEAPPPSHLETRTTTSKKEPVPLTITSTGSTTASVTLAPVPPNAPKLDKGKAVVWGVSPSLVPEAKKYSVESDKDVTQLLESLRHCFADLGQYDLTAKPTKNGVKVTARKSGKRHGAPVATVNLLKKEDGETELILKGGKSKEQFKVLAKKVEETLVV